MGADGRRMDSDEIMAEIVIHRLTWIAFSSSLSTREMMT